MDATERLMEIVVTLPAARGTVPSSVRAALALRKYTLNPVTSLRSEDPAPMPTTPPYTPMRGSESTNDSAPGFPLGLTKSANSTVAGATPSVMLREYTARCVQLLDAGAEPCGIVYDTFAPIGDMPACSSDADVVHRVPAASLAQRSS